MIAYRAYGLGILSAFRLPGLLPGGEGAPDVTIVREALGDPPGAPIEPGGLACVLPGLVRFRWEAVAACEVRGGREIALHPAPGVDEALLSLYILGPALGALLHQRGGLVLHASAVTAAGGCIAFIGGSGWGKSTLAAALCARGCGLVADDVTVVETPSARVPPGIPRLKLWPDSAAAAGFPPEDLEPLHGRTEKVAVPIRRGFPASPLPLRRIYSLAEGERPGVAQVAPGEAFLDLVRHAYAARILEATGTARAHFAAASAVAAAVPVRRLVSWANLREIDRVCDLVLEDISHAL